MLLLLLQSLLNTKQQRVSMTFPKYVDLIESYLQYSLQHTSMPASLIEPFTYIMAPGGKRIRPVLCLLAAEAVGGQPEQAVSAGAAVEILHNFTLVHDDIMDRSPMRRGNPTVHTKWDDSTAILTGDVMMAYAYRMLISSLPTQHLYSVLQSFTKGFVEVCEGQALDIEFHHRKTVSLDEYIEMIEKKTARLLELSVVVGATLGGGTDTQIELLRAFAQNIGIAFQIQDDILDLTADVQELGKTIGQDIVEGKKTYLIIRATELVTKESHKKLLQEFWDNNGVPANRVNEMRLLMEELGVLNDARAKAQHYFSKAHQDIQQLPPSNARNLLFDVIEMLNVRKK